MGSIRMIFVVSILGASKWAERDHVSVGSQTSHSLFEPLSLHLSLKRSDRWISQTYPLQEQLGTYGGPQVPGFTLDPSSLFLVLSDWLHMSGPVSPRASCPNNAGLGKDSITLRQLWLGCQDPSSTLDGALSWLWQI